MYIFVFLKIIKYGFMLTQTDGKLSDNEIQKLLKNIAHVLKTHSLSELNDLLLGAINNKSDTKEHENYIIELVCEAYGVSRVALIESKSNPNVTKPRQVAFCLLHYTLGLSVRKIAKMFHFKYHNTVGKAVRMYKTLDPNIKPDREMKQAISLIEEKVLVRINNNS